MSINLSRWDLVDEFTAKEAACLILGLDAHDPAAPTWAVEPILKRMRESYERTAICMVLDLQQDKNNQEGLKVRNFMELMGRKLMFFYFETERQSGDLRPTDEVTDRLCKWFDQDTFRRPEIARWLSLFSIESKYPFDPSQQPERGTESIKTNSERPIPIIEARVKRLQEIATGLGFQVPNLPERVGKQPGPKARIKELALKDAALFTAATFEQAWQKSGLKDGGVKRA